MGCPSWSRPTRRRDESGSALLLVVGATSVLILALVLLADAGVLFHQRRSASAAADSAAQYASLAVAGVPRGAQSGRVAAAAARRALLLGEARPAPTLESVRVAGGRVRVVVRRDVRLPFAGALGLGEVPVRAQAVADVPG